MQVTTSGGNRALESPDGEYVYYSKREPGIWRMPVKGGEESLILDQAMPNYWDLLAEGICFIGMGEARQPSIEFFNFATRQVTQLTRLEQGKSPFGAPNLSVSGDGQWVLYFQADQSDNDIMLVENFR